MNNSKHDNSQGSEQQHSDRHGLFLSSRRVAWLVSANILVCCFIFIAGYFLGKKNAAEKFYDKIEQDSFADHIYYSMCSMYDNGTVEKNNGGGTEAAEEKTASETTDKESSLDKQAVVCQREQHGARVAPEHSAEEKTVVSEEKDGAQYYAELAGFGTEAAAKKCADQLKQKNITVLLKKRHSKTARGRVATWYQLVSETFSNKNDLRALVDDISALKGLKNVRIVTC